eukprot:Skav223943  [mRNA]  locus=scaffold1465:385569:403251:+ [translate_table: standard]
MDIQQVSCSSGAFCAIRGDGEIVTWGSPELGGRVPRLVREKLIHVKEEGNPMRGWWQVCASQGAFAALLGNGSVVTWGDVDYGGESQVHQEELRDVRLLRSSFTLFAAICGDERRVVTWGNCCVIAPWRWGLGHVRDLVWSSYAFAAVTEDGLVSTWGLPTCGGDLPPNVQDQLHGVEQLAASHAAFAARRSDGKAFGRAWKRTSYGAGSAVRRAAPGGLQPSLLRAAVRWLVGYLGHGHWDGERGVSQAEESHGGCSESVESQLYSVQRVVATSRAFAALRADGKVVTWGAASYGGDSEDVQDQLIDVQQLSASHSSFAALTAAGQLICWGLPLSGGGAVFENMDLKKEIFAKWAAERPSEVKHRDVIGCHFFSPANVMKLLENVRGPRTGAETMSTAMSFGKKLGKVTCLVGNCPGFIANRVMGASGAFQLLAEGVFPYEIDAAAEAYGMRMGPIRMWDLVGLDLFGRERERAGELDPEKVVVDAM